MVKEKLKIASYREQCYGISKVEDFVLIKPEIDTWECTYWGDFFCEDRDYYSITEAGENSCLKCSRERGEF